MTLADIAETMPPRRRSGSRCTVAVVRDWLTPVDLVTFDRWITEKLPDGRYRRSGEWISDTVNQLPYLEVELPAGSITRHRRGCRSCPR